MYCIIIIIAYIITLFYYYKYCLLGTMEGRKRDRAVSVLRRLEHALVKMKTVPREDRRLSALSTKTGCIHFLFPP